MKKARPYILIGLILIAVLLLFLTGDRQQHKRFDDRITLRAKDKIPYGTYIAYESLDDFFPHALVSKNSNAPGAWDSLSNFQDRQALLIVCPDFSPDEYEMKNLIHFAQQGNDVFVSTMNISYEATQLMKCDINASEALMYYYASSKTDDTLLVSLQTPAFGSGKSYSYPGKRYDFYFDQFDTITTTVLGFDGRHRPNFIQLRAGEGNLFVHLAPLTLSNYFLLQKGNLAYYEGLLSAISPNANSVVWDEYFLTKRKKTPRSNNWITRLLEYPSLRWAILTALLALLVYVLLEMRRKQRVIPLIRKPVNDSLEFVRTIGRLYHDKGDHKNLSRKMSAYFLEYVRSRYKLSTNALNEAFIEQLHGKSGIAKEEVAELIGAIDYTENAMAVSEHDLASLHKKLEAFYQKV